jgi:methylated-DNA-protein-cysteine methyltransferase-like protein
MAREADFHDRVLEVIARLQPGDVVSYGEVAAEAGNPGAARAVGALLAAGAGGPDLPWWRVVTSAGRLVPGHEALHARLLRREGVGVTNGRVAGYRRRARAGSKRTTSGGR